VLLMVQGCKTSRRAVERSVRLLKRANARIGGIILNLLPNRRVGGGYYYSYYLGYGYGSYGKKEEDKNSVVIRM
jgi:Mrp family chromosome partitioning ATPase